MFGRVSDNWEEYQTNERLAHVSFLHDRLDAVDEVFSTDGDTDSDKDQSNSSGLGRENLCFLVSFFITLIAFALFVKELLVHLQLE